MNTTLIMASCQIKRSSWLPIAFSIFLSTGIIISFILHYTREDIYIFPQISQAAGNQPQSGIFCIFLFLAVFTGFISMLLRFSSIRDMNHPINRIVNGINALSILAGIISLMGMILVAAYPLSPAPQDEPRDWFQVAIRPHQGGSRTLFICINVYYVLQTVLTVILWKKEGVVLCCIRVLLVILTITTYIVMSTVPYPRCENCPGRNGTIVGFCDTLTSKLVQESSTIEIEGHVWNLTLADKEFCKASDRYFDTVAISELVLAILLVAYILTFCKEFHRISLSTIIKYEFEHIHSKPLTDLSATTPL